jgi:hypothetical protein
MAQRPPRPGDDYDEFYGRPSGDRPASEKSVRSTRALLGLVGVLAVAAIALGVFALVSVGDDEGQDQADPGSERLLDLRMQVESLRERIGDLPGELAGGQEQPTEDTGQEDRLRDRIDELEDTVRDLGGSRGDGEGAQGTPSEPDAAP